RRLKSSTNRQITGTISGRRGLMAHCDLSQAHLIPESAMRAALGPIWTSTNTRRSSFTVIQTGHSTRPNCRLSFRPWNGLWTTRIEATDRYLAIELQNYLG